MQSGGDTDGVLDWGSGLSHFCTANIEPLSPKKHGGLKEDNLIDSDGTVSFSMRTRAFTIRGSLSNIAFLWLYRLEYTVSYKLLCSYLIERLSVFQLGPIVRLTAAYWPELQRLTAPLWPALMLLFDIASSRLFFFPAASADNEL